jgi:integrase/recombinase XerD
MATARRLRGGKLRGQKAIPHSLDEVIRDTFRLWRKYHLGYDQTKYVVERVRRRLTLQSPHTRSRTVARLEQSEVQRLIQTTYRSRSKYGLMIKTLFQTGARVDEFVHIRVEDLFLDGDHPRFTSSTRSAGPIVMCRYCRRWRMNFALISKADSYLRATDRRLFDPHGAIDRNDLRSPAGIKKRVYPHLLRHSIATILLDSGLVPIDQLQKLLKPVCAPSATITSGPWAGCSRYLLCRNWAFAGLRPSCTASPAPALILWTLNRSWD